MTSEDLTADEITEQLEDLVHSLGTGERDKTISDFLDEDAPDSQRTLKNAGAMEKTNTSQNKVRDSFQTGGHNDQDLDTKFRAIMAKIPRFTPVSTQQPYRRTFLLPSERYPSDNDNEFSISSLQQDYKITYPARMNSSENSDGSSHTA
ncbi:hypothetical protein Ciccas_010643, partial [Cichlidogyrus casuarinus]